MAIEKTSQRSRRSLLTAIGAAVAGAAAATLTGAQRVLGAGDDGTPIAIGGYYDDARKTTFIINNSNGLGALSAGNNQGGTGVSGFSLSGTGVNARSDSSYALYAESVSGEGVYGASTAGTGVHGVAGPVNGIAHNYPAAVLGEAVLPDAGAMLANNYATHGLAVGVQGTSDSPAGLAAIGWARHGGTGVSGVVGSTFPVVPSKTGVYGKATNGRGVVASGGKAQIRLVPSAAATHPSSGALGDLFLDKNKRLWFCKGGSAWKQIV